MWTYNFLRTKHFHGVSSAGPHVYSLKSRYGKVSCYKLSDSDTLSAPLNVGIMAFADLRAFSSAVAAPEAGPVGAVAPVAALAGVVVAALAAVLAGVVAPAAGPVGAVAPVAALAGVVVAVEIAAPEEVDPFWVTPAPLVCSC
jgi:hypothetical protein